MRKKRLSAAGAGSGLALTPLAAALGIVAVLTIITGLSANRGVVTHPPLEILRSEGA